MNDLFTYRNLLIRDESDVKRGIAKMFLRNFWCQAKFCEVLQSFVYGVSADICFR